MSAARDAALFACDDIRIDDSGVSVVDGLNLEVSGPVALVLGAPRALFAAASGLALPLRGKAIVDGRDARLAASEGHLHACPAEPALPGRFTPVEYLVWSARLAGSDAKEARARADASLEKTKLAFARKERIDRLPIAARRALAFAAALARGARVVVLEDPLAGLPEETAEAHAAVLLEALEGRALLVFAARLRLASTLVARADDVAVVAGDAVIHRGPPETLGAHATTYALRAEGSPEAVAALTARVEASGGSLRSAGPARLVLDLGPSMTTAELLGHALAADVLVVEIRAVAHALA